MTMETILQSTVETIITKKLSNTENKIENLALQFQSIECLMKELLNKANPEEKLTCKEAAVILKVTENTVREFCRKDKIKYEKLGGQYRIKRSELTHYLNRF